MKRYLSPSRVTSPLVSWLILAFIFLFLSIDETAMIHEKLVEYFRESFNTSGIFYYAWVVPYGVALILILFAYINFLKELPRYIMILFLISGAIYILGAIGFEMASGRHHELYGKKNLIYSILFTCEEFLEMLGILIFIYALLTYITIKFKTLEITIK